MPTKSYGLDNVTIQEARTNGGITFRPVSGNRLICNQAPGLGRMSSRQAQGLRKQVWPSNRSAKATAAKSAEAITKKKVMPIEEGPRDVWADRYGLDGVCQWCRAELLGLTRETVQCPECKRPIKVFFF